MISRLKLIGMALIKKEKKKRNRLKKNIYIYILDDWYGTAKKAFVIILPTYDNRWCASRLNNWFKRWFNSTSIFQTFSDSHFESWKEFSSFSFKKNTQSILCFTKKIQSTELMSPIR